MIAIIVVCYLLMMALGYLFFGGIGLLVSRGLGPILFFSLVFYFVGRSTHKREAYEEKVKRLKEINEAHKKAEELKNRNTYRKENLFNVEEALRDRKKRELEELNQVVDRRKKEMAFVDEEERKKNESFKQMQEANKRFKKSKSSIEDDRTIEYEAPEPDYDCYNFNEDLADNYEYEVMDRDFPGDEWWG